MLKSFILSLLLFCSFTTAFAQLQFNSLAEVIQYADQHATVAREAVLYKSSAQQDAALQTATLLPKLSGFSTADYYPIIASQLIPASFFGSKSDEYKKVQFGLPFIVTAGLELSMPIINFEKWETVAKTKAQVNQVQSNQNAVLENMHLQLTQFYFQYLVYKKLQALNQQNEADAQHVLEVMQLRFKQDLLNPADLNRYINMHIDIQNAGLQYAKAQQQAQLNLQNILNQSAAPIVISDSISNFTFPDWKGDASTISYRPALAEMNWRYAMAQHTLAESRRAVLPKLALYSKYAYNWQMRFDPNTHAGYDVNSIGLKLDVPLFNGTFNAHQMQKSAIQLQIAGLEKERISNQLLQQQHEWENSYRIARLQNSSLQQKLSNCNENLRIALLQVKEGVMEVEEFNTVYRDYLKTQMDYYQNLTDGILFYTLLQQTTQTH